MKITVDVFTPFVSSVKDGEKRYRLQHTGTKTIEGRNYGECQQKVAKMNAGITKYKIRG